MPAYDYLIVGAGFFGSVFARQATDAGRRCLVIDRRDHIAGNAHNKEIEGITVHCYGAHIFHTSDEQVWDYVCRYARFNHYVNSPVARYGDALYNLPFNMNTFYQLWGVCTPAQAQAKIQAQRQEIADTQDLSQPARNLEEQALRLVGRDVYEKLIRGYTEKQWGRPCDQLPAFIIRRLPLRFTFDNNYFNDPHQGIPIDGYDALIAKLLEGSELRLSTDYTDLIRENPDIAKKTVYTGMIDDFFGYSLGHLEYRSLRFETQVLDCPNYQGNAVVNYTSADVPYTRIIEHKHFLFGQQDKTVISREYPQTWEPGLEPYYPINDARNLDLIARYRELAKSRPDVIFGGRLGTYQYYDMDKTVRAALDAAQLENLY